MATARLEERRHGERHGPGDLRGSRIANPSSLTATGTRAYYTRAGGSGPALWMTETAPGGISLQVLDMAPFAGGGGVRMMSGSGGSVYAAFSQTSDGVGRLIRSDGTIGGSGIFREFTPAATLDSNPRLSATIGASGPVVFVANGVSGVDGLWTSDGTAGNTSLLHAFTQKGVVTAAAPVVYNGRAYYVVKQANYLSEDEGLWSTDGVSASLVASIDHLQGSDSMATFSGSLYFNAMPDDGSFRTKQLWTSNGTSASPVRTFATSVTDLVSNDSRLYMTADDGAGPRLWSMTTAGVLAEVTFGANQPLTNPSRVTMVGQTPFVVAGSFGSRRLYRINSQGVASVVNDTGSNPVTVSDTPYLASTGSALVFNGLVNGSPVLWVTGASGAAGLVTLGGQTVANPGQPVSVGGNAYFAADGPGGRELYRFDGNTASLLRDINPGAGGSNPSDLTAVGSTLVFLANNGVDGVEPWISDGTVNGTKLAAKIAPGSAGATTGTGPLVLGRAGGRTLLALSDGSRGVEPWAMVINPPSNTPPTLDPIANQVVKAGQVLTFRAIGSDVDAGQTLTYSLENSPPRAPRSTRPRASSPGTSRPAARSTRPTP
ncbi:MAG: hypothetical protein U0800_13010 [Isosphaeraceae bacterium]